MQHTTKPVYNDHPRDPNIEAVVDSWWLFKGHLFNKIQNRTLKWRLLLAGGCYSEEVVNSGLAVRTYFNIFAISFYVFFFLTTLFIIHS